MDNTATTTSSSKQALWFLIVGASAALVHFLVLVSVVNFSSISPSWANVIAFLVAFMVSFIGHFYLTFRQPLRDNTTKSDIALEVHDTVGFIKKIKKNTLHALIKWFASSAAGFLVNQGLFVLGLYWFGERYYILVWLVVTTIITVMTFGLGKLWAFKP